MSRLAVVACFVAGVSVGAALVGAGLYLSSPEAGQPRASATRPQRAPARLDTLRNEAAIGDDRSNHALVDALLDGYDETGDAQALLEAVVWLDRQADPTQDAAVARRVVTHYCGHPAMRWHWLCLPGE